MEGRKDMFYLTTHSTHFIFTVIWHWSYLMRQDNTIYLKQKIVFNNTLNTFLINGYIGIRNILIGKIPSGYLTGLDLRLTVCQTGTYTTRLSRHPPTIYLVCFV